MLISGYKKLIVGTHDEQFHADDVNAVAALLLLGVIYDIKRTRDPEVLATCDIRIDVGGKYNPATLDFDHHQEGGAGKRSDDGIPYSSFGLLWREVGLELCGSVAAARKVDSRYVQPIDARDCGLEVPMPKDLAYTVSEGISDANPIWDGSQDFDDEFQHELVCAARRLTCVIRRAKAELRAPAYVRKMLDARTDPRLLILDKAAPWTLTVLKEAPKVLFVLFPANGASGWRIQPVNNGHMYRKPFPTAWLGKKGEEFAALTGVGDARFCHNIGYIAGADTEEGAIALAKLALTT